MSWRKISTERESRQSLQCLPRLCILIPSPPTPCIALTDLSRLTLSPILSAPATWPFIAIPFGWSRTFVVGGATRKECRSGSMVKGSPSRSQLKRGETKKLSDMIGGYQRMKNWKLVIPLDLTNFTSAGVLNPNQSQATAQAALLPSPPLPTKEWVCFEDYYSDEEQSVSETVRTSREVQPDSIASQSVFLALTSIDTAATGDTVPGLTVSHPCVVLPAPPSATAVAPQSVAHPPAVFAGQSTTSTALA